MKIPSESELSEEQKAIIFAPLDGTMLVVGPPGSGKTVIAHYQADRERRNDNQVHLLMFNQVLRKYTGDAETFLTWIKNWWGKATGERFPTSTGENGRDVMDWRAALTDVRRRRQRLREYGGWGHMILDEAQDFSNNTHKLLWKLKDLVFTTGSERPTLLILADDNQRITSEQSTTAEIQKAHWMGEDNLYRLTRNYRNTKPIARLAQKFCTEVSEKAVLPEKTGDLPKLVLTDGVDEAARMINQYASNHANREIGVLVYYENTRKDLYGKLEDLLPDSIRLQTYTSSCENARKMANKLRFGDGGCVTVLCYASGKGLEFDAVFLPELQSQPAEGEHRDQARMGLYVMMSRAREDLWIMISDPEENSPIWTILPDSEDRELWNKMPPGTMKAQLRARESSSKVYYPPGARNAHYHRRK